MRRHRARSPHVALVPVVIALAMAVPSTALARGGCVVADVPAPVVLPDGSVHPAGPLRLCLERNLNPVAEMHRISIAGGPQGMFVGQRRRAELDVRHASMVFYRADNDDWVLVGLLEPARSRREHPTRVLLVERSRLAELAAAGRGVADSTTDERAVRARSFESFEPDRGRTFHLVARAVN